MSVVKLLRNVVATSVGYKMNRPIFGYDYNGVNVEWTWRVRELEKIYWKTWKPRLNDIKILNLTDSDEVAKVQQEIFQGVIDSEHPKKEKLTGIYKVRAI